MTYSEFKLKAEDLERAYRAGVRRHAEFKTVVSLKEVYFMKMHFLEQMECLKKEYGGSN